MSKEPILQETENQDKKREEARKPKNLSANAIPIDGFVLAVDAKFKTRFESSDEAMAAAVKLKRSYPVIQVAVYDAAARVYTPVNLPAQDT
jgi:hypothetical protein